MAMSFQYCTPGAEVAKVLDCEKYNADTNTYKWKPANPHRRGFIVETIYSGGEEAISDGVAYVMVKFEAGKPPEKCIPTQLNLIKMANEAALMALKNEVAIAKANDGLIDDMKKPLVTDMTGVGKTKPGKGMSDAEAKEFAKR